MDAIEEKKPEIAIVNIEGDLYFAAVEELKEQIQPDLKFRPEGY